MIWLFPSTSDFTATNPFWNGLGDFLDNESIIPMTSWESLPKSSSDTAILIIPYREPSQTYLAALRRHFDNGGTIILADDYGYGNMILKSLDLPHRFSESQLVDPLVNAGNKMFPLVTHIDPSPLTKGVSVLALNYGSAILTNKNSGLITLASSSPFSFLDSDTDGFRDPIEPQNLHPVVAYGESNPGHLVLISDPSIFINGMIEIHDNSQFISNLITAFSVNNSLFLDTSLLPLTTLDRSKNEFEAIRTAFGQVEIFIPVVLILITVWTYPIWRKKGTRH